MKERLGYQVLSEEFFEISTCWRNCGNHRRGGSGGGDAEGDGDDGDLDLNNIDLEPATPEHVKPYLNND